MGVEDFLSLKGELYRSIEFSCQPACTQLCRKGVAFSTIPSPHIGFDQTNIGFRNTQHVGHRFVDIMRVLSRGPKFDSSSGQGLCDRSMGLERHMG